MSTTHNVRIFCSDLDGTLLGESSSTEDFSKRWKSLESAKPLLIYSTGRLHDDALKVITEAGLPEADFLVSGVGTMIHDLSTESFNEDFAALLDESWQRDLVHQILKGLEGIMAQPEIQQHRWKSSWFWQDREEAQIEALRETLEAAATGAQVVYSSDRDLDVIPMRANKGNALKWLCEKLGIPTSTAVVAGDSGNDASMFLVDGVRGIAPANSEPALLAAIKNADHFHSSASCAAGVVQGFQHLGLFKS